MTETTVGRTIDIVAFGRRLKGTYVLDGDLVRVKTSLGEKSSPLRNTIPESVAGFSLIEMAREGKARSSKWHWDGSTTWAVQLEG